MPEAPLIGVLAVTALLMPLEGRTATASPLAYFMGGMFGLAGLVGIAWRQRYRS